MRYTVTDATAWAVPTLRACRECWMESCDHDAGVHEWPAEFGHLAVKHPGLTQFLAVRFRYPLTMERRDEIMAALRVALLQHGVDPDEVRPVLDERGSPILLDGERLQLGESITEAIKRHVVEVEPIVEWWIEPESTIPEQFLAG